ncbi:STAS-like domain-containing protein [Leptodesmis sp.]|uniref:STAS-like domain-containing protein n=1 Tax=Leptodesmis sp. TaxID=3100501 RepID=UPI00405352DF
MIVIVLRLADIARGITSFPSLLATRLAGKRFWEQLQKCLRESDADTVITLSFAGVDVMDASFADEVFGTLAARRARKDVTFGPVILMEANETCVENLKMALETRADRESPDRERLRNCVLPMLKGDEMTLIGKFEDHVLQSFELLSKHKTLTARDLSDVLKLNLNAASTRLKTLADLGLARRIEIRDAQGKQFVYHSLQ